MVDYSGVLAKLERAKTHADEFAYLAASFLRRHPYRVLQKLDFEEEQFGFDVTLKEALPSTLPVALGDAVHNLRSTLDYLISANAHANGKTFRDTKFLIARDSASFEARVHDSLRKAGPTVIEVCRALRPYPGGNNTLWELHELDLRDKHQLLLTAAAAGELGKRYIEREGKAEHSVSDAVYFLGAETQFVPAPAGYEYDTPFEIGISLDIVFPANTPLAGIPCLPKLDEMIDVVSAIVRQFHDSCP